MPAEFVILANGHVAGIVGSEVVVSGDLTTATRQLLSLGDDRLAAFYAGLINLTATETFQVEVAGVETLVALDLTIARKMRPGLPVAAAAPRDLPYGMSRMWQSLAEATGWEIRVFRGRDEAVAWLRARASQKFGVELPEF